jgi:DNA-binding CsgD family transcriptional regulator
MEKGVLDDKLVYIVGPARFQNELMASFLERETGIQCQILSDLRDIPGGNDSDTDRQRLIFLDCLRKDRNSLLADLESCGTEMLSRVLCVLFNVTQGLGIEEIALQWGIKGVFYENDPMEHYPKGVWAVFNGELWLSRQIMTTHILKAKRRNHTYKKDVASLTRREVEVLSMVAIGCTNEEIADDLCISSNTVKTHTYNIFKKINVPNRLQAALWASKNL